MTVGGGADYAKAARTIKNKEFRYKSKRQTLTTLLFRHFYRADLSAFGHFS